MRKRIKVITLILLMSVLAVTLTLYLNSRGNAPSAISPDQQKVLEIMGYPQQFVITYIERGGDDSDLQLVRDEIWYYPDQQKVISFLAGKLAYSDNYQPQEKSTATTLRPEDFEFAQDLSDLSKILGKNNVSEVTDLPGFSEEKNVKVYVSPNAVFIIENGYLTYFQTLGQGDPIPE